MASAIRVEECSVNYSAASAKKGDLRLDDHSLRHLPLFAREYRVVYKLTCKDILSKDGVTFFLLNLDRSQSSIFVTSN